MQSIKHVKQQTHPLLSNTDFSFVTLGICRFLRIFQDKLQYQDQVNESHVMIISHWLYVYSHDFWIIYLHANLNSAGYALYPRQHVILINWLLNVCSMSQTLERHWCYIGHIILDHLKVGIAPLSHISRWLKMRRISRLEWECWGEGGGS